MYKENSVMQSSLSIRIISFSYKYLMPKLLEI